MTVRIFQIVGISRSQISVIGRRSVFEEAKSKIKIDRDSSNFASDIEAFILRIKLNRSEFKIPIWVVFSH